MNKKIAVIVGSLRKDSLNRKMALVLKDLAPKTLELSIVEIGNLQMYNQDLDESPPTNWVEFRNQLREFDGVLFVTPEYNRSVPGVLKNAIDVASRPYGKSAWENKPTSIVSVSQGNIGGFGANHHLRQCFVFLNMPAMQQPEAYIGGASKLFDEHGKLTNDSTRELMQKFINAFADWVTKNAPRTTS